MTTMQRPRTLAGLGRKATRERDQRAVEGVNWGGVFDTIVNPGPSTFLGRPLPPQPISIGSGFTPRPVCVKFSTVIGSGTMDDPYRLDDNG